MGQKFGKTKRKSKCIGWACNPRHCCKNECFANIPKAYEMIDVLHIGWIFTARHEKELQSFFTANNILIDLIEIIIIYLPSYRLKNSKILTSKAYSNKNEEYHCFFHAYISPLWNEYKPPCNIWLSSQTTRKGSYFYSWSVSLSYSKEKLPENIPIFKVALLGAGAVGKSALVIRYIANEFQDEYDPTIEDSYQRFLEINPMEKDIDAFKVNDSGDENHKYEYVAVDVLDTAAREQYASLQHHWIRETEIFLLCFSINSERTFKHVDYLIKTILRSCEGEEKTFAMILVGTKGDLRNNASYNGDVYDKIVDVDTIIAATKKWNIPYIETSALIGRNVNFLFRQAIYEYWIQSNHYWIQQCQY
eukprot:392921_1